MTILTLFFDMKAKPKELYELNKNGKFLFILLYILKTTLFDDIKSIVYDFTMILLNDTSTNSSNNNSNANTYNNIKQYLEYNLLPYYLLIDEKGKSIKVMNVSGEIDEGKFNEFFFSCSLLSITSTFLPRLFAS